MQRRTVLKVIASACSGWLTGCAREREHEPVSDVPLYTPLPDNIGKYIVINTDQYCYIVAKGIVMAIATSNSEGAKTGEVLIKKDSKIVFVDKEDQLHSTSSLSDNEKRAFTNYAWQAQAIWANEIFKQKGDIIPLQKKYEDPRDIFFPELPKIGKKPDNKTSYRPPPSRRAIFQKLFIQS